MKSSACAAAPSQLFPVRRAAGWIFDGDGPKGMIMLETRKWSAGARRPGRRSWGILAAGLMLGLAVSGEPAHAAKAPAAGGDGCRFTSSGHILSFREGGVLVAAADHALDIAWVGNHPVSPRTDPKAGEPRTAGEGAAVLDKVAYPGIWDGVDAVFERGSGILKSSYRIAAGAGKEAVARIRLRSNRPVRIASDGALIYDFAAGSMRETRPVAWQETGAGRKPVTAAFRLSDEGEIGFTIGPWEADVPLVIDPELTWATFLGGSGTDQCRSLAVDAAGNIFIAGNSTAGWGTPVRAFVYGADAFVAKLDSSGNLLWNTFLGGDGSDYAYSVFAGADGSVYVAGSSDATWGAPIRSYTYLDDAFAAKLDGNGSLIWNTFLGAANTDYAYAIAADGAGNVLVGGQSYSTWGAPVRAYTSACDGFVAKLTSAGAVAWNTFLGGYGNDYIHYGLALDENGGIYIAGTSAATWGSPLRAYSASDDAFAAKLDASGNLLWNTFLGGSGSDYGLDIALDAGGNIYLSGTGDAAWGAPVRAYTANADGFVVKLDANGGFLWNTFLGGPGIDYGYSVAVDGNGNVYLGGHSTASWGTPERAYTSGYDAYVAKLDSGGALLWNMFLGGSGDDYGYGVALDGIGNIYLGGYSGASWGTPVRAYTSGNDAFAVKISGSMNIVHLLSFTASHAADRVDLAWATAYETDCTGFHLWRAEVLSGPYTRITMALIPAQGGPTQGAEYGYRDFDVTAGRAYFYKLEAVDSSGRSDLFGPVASWSAGEVVVPLTPADGGVATVQAPPRFSWMGGVFSRFRIELCSDTGFGSNTIIWPFNAAGHTRIPVENRWITATDYVPGAAEWKAACPAGQWPVVYWRIRAKDAIGRETVSAIFRLRLI